MSDLTNSHTYDLDDWWNTFEIAVLPADAPPIQRREMRRAFYAGIHIMFTFINRIPADCPDKTIEVAFKSIREQLVQFVKDMLEE